MEPQNSQNPDDKSATQDAPGQIKAENFNNPSEESTGGPAGSIYPDQESSKPHQEFKPSDTSSASEKPFYQSLPSMQPAETVAPAAAAPTTTAAPAAAQHQDAGLVILQWLTYAFWGWALIALSSLTSAILANFIADAESGTFVFYAIAAVAVLLPAAFICDRFYMKREPAKKTGAALAVMVIHAVIFALFGIGALITTVFMLVSIVIESGEDKSRIVVLLSALIIAVFYALVFLRTLNIERLRRFNRYFGYLMVATVGLLIILGVAGPIAKEWSLRDEKLIEGNLGELSREINNYVNDNSELPDSLSQLELEGDVKLLVTKDLVEYKKLNPQQSTMLDGASYSTSRSLNSTQNFYYELCATFQQETPYYDSYNQGDRENEYRAYVSAYYHPEGYHCFKVKTSLRSNNQLLR